MASTPTPTMEGLWLSSRYGSTVVASVVGHHKAHNGSHTVYEIDVHVRHGVEVVSVWSVNRRYNDFHKLHKELKEHSFPCPELPPKQLLWATFNQSSFLQQRMEALNVWLQGSLCIWQSIKISSVEASYEIAELLEEFLCADEALDDVRAKGISSPFALRDENKNSNKVNLKSTTPDDQGGSFPPDASSSKLPREKKLNVGVAISLDEESVDNEQHFLTFTGDGKSVQQTFRPFTATVQYGDNTPVVKELPIGSAAVSESSVAAGSRVCCTPVSVPPTPHGQHEFLNSWSRYTETVLEYVADRLQQKPLEGEDVDKNDIDDETRTLTDGDGDSEEYLDDEEESCDFSNDGLEENQEYISISTKTGGEKKFVFSTSSVARRTSEQLEDESTTERDTGLTRKRERIDRNGQTLIRKLLRETCNALDFVGSSYEFLAKMKGVIVLKKKTQGNQHCFMGRGALNCSAKDVFDLVSNPSTRHIYDRMVKEGSERLIETWEGDDNPIVFQHVFETKQRLCFLRSSRDFCILQYSKQLEDGRYVVVGRSIKHEKCPPTEGTVRAKIDLYGWVIEPDVTNSPPDASTSSKCKATYLVQVDFGGNVPNKFIESMSFRQPLCIRYVENHLLRKMKKISSSKSLSKHGTASQKNNVPLSDKKADI
uniref:PX domain-containing protein n=1 Tax=Mucochytrium quahogii TaxID=96639 RepID=A0A7S2W2V7_9STRA|mmetsp:Transcript_10318/g.16835  ORF Transcript_10318/g.16835 Transcript_10318/m.16835 type:complete len:654 (+) Transcript_10318:275-2236(+)